MSLSFRRYCLSRPRLVFKEIFEFQPLNSRVRQKRAREQSRGPGCSGCGQKRLSQKMTRTGKNAVKMTSGHKQSVKRRHEDPSFFQLFNNGSRRLTSALLPQEEKVITMNLPAHILRS